MNAISLPGSTTSNSPFPEKLSALLPTFESVVRDVPESIVASFANSPALSVTMESELSSKFQWATSPFVTCGPEGGASAFELIVVESAPEVDCSMNLQVF